MPYDYVDEIVPDSIPCSITGSSIARRSRLDESAGEGLRRNVLLRNAMLSSLERERRQMAEEVPFYGAAEQTLAAESSSSAADMDDEAQFFDDLLSELSGSDYHSSTDSQPEPNAQGFSPSSDSSTQMDSADDVDDFVELEKNSLEASVPQLPELISADCTASPDQDVSESDSTLLGKVTRSALPPPTLLDSCISVNSTSPGCGDSGFAEEASRPSSAASCCTGYPNVCPYPAVSSYVGGSSEELPALIDDDSDLDEDEDEVNDRDESERDAALNQDNDPTVSRPLSPITSPVHSVYAEFTSFRDPLSPDSSRPTSPISSASSKGDGEGPSPLLLPTNLDALPSLAELSLQIPVAPAADPRPRPSRSLAGAWFDHKQEGSNGSSSNTDRMRWTTSPASYLRSPSPASTTAAPDFQHHRLSYGAQRSSNYPAQALNDPTDHSIVVHWSR